MRGLAERRRLGAPSTSASSGDSTRSSSISSTTARAIAPPARVRAGLLGRQAVVAIPTKARTPAEPTGRRANVVRFPELTTSKMRAVLHTSHRAHKSGLTEFEVWGDATLAHRARADARGQPCPQPQRARLPESGGVVHVAVRQGGDGQRRRRSTSMPRRTTAGRATSRRTKPTGWRSTSAKRSKSAASSWPSTTTAAECKHRPTTRSSTSTAKIGARSKGQIVRLPSPPAANTMRCASSRSRHQSCGLFSSIAARLEAE